MKVVNCPRHCPRHLFTVFLITVLVTTAVAHFHVVMATACLVIPVRRFFMNVTFADRAETKESSSLVATVAPSRKAMFLGVIWGVFRSERGYENIVALLTGTSSAPCTEVGTTLPTRWAEIDLGPPCVTADVTVTVGVWPVWITPWGTIVMVWASH